MGFFSRSLRLVSANLHDRLDQLEQPEQLARHGLRELDRALRDATAAAARSIAAERVLQQRRDARQREIAALAARAADAVRAGHDPEAQRLLELKFARLQALAQVDRQLLDARQVNERLRAHVRRMQEYRRDEQSRLESFIARRATATAARSLAAQITADRDRVVIDVSKDASMADLGMLLEMQLDRHVQERTGDVPLPTSAEWLIIPIKQEPPPGFVPRSSCGGCELLHRG